MQLEVIHKNVNVVVITINNDMILPSDKSKTFAHFEKKISDSLGQFLFYAQFIL